MHITIDLDGETMREMIIGAATEGTEMIVKRADHALEMMIREMNVGVDDLSMRDRKVTGNEGEVQGERAASELEVIAREILDGKEGETHRLSFKRICVPQACFMT